MKKRVFLLTAFLLSSLSLFAENAEQEAAKKDSVPEESTTLDEIVVKAPLVRRDADRIVLNISANPLSANKNVKELLQTAPGVWADDDRLSIYGQEGTTVYIDDRKVNMSGKQLMTYLKSIHSSSIATIEIIPKAGAEYSADSSGGIIKINLKRNRIDGISGSAGMNFTQGKYKQWFNPFVNFGLHSGKWTFSLNSSINGSPYDRYTSFDKSYNNIVAQNMDGISHHDGKAIQGNLMLGLFYEPSEKDKLGLQFDYNLEWTRNRSDSETIISGENLINQTNGIYRNDDRFHNLNVSFNWSHKIDKQGSLLKLISNYNYRNSSVNEDNEMSWSDLAKDSVYSTDNANRYNIFVTEISLKKVFNANWNMNVGAKYTFNNVSNISSHHYLADLGWIPNTLYDYDNGYDENIIAFYATANGRAGRWKFKAGVRGEYFNTAGEITNARSFNLFPNANLVYDITENGDYTVALGYYRNIRRPSFRALDPTIRQVADYYYTVGNPHLSQSLTDGVSIDFILARKYTVAMGYSETDRPIRQVFATNIEYPERMYLTWENEGKDRSFYIHADGSFNITDWWNLYASATYILKSQKLHVSDPYDTFGYVQLVGSTSFILPHDFNLSVNCFYTSKMKIGNITVYPILNINPRLQKRFGKQWSLSLGLENMLQRQNRLRNTSANYDRFLHSKNYLAVNLGVTYNFSSGKKFRTPRVEKNIDNSRLSKE